MKTRGQREFEARIRQSRGLAHPAAPRSGAAGWETLCARDGCGRTFVTPTKQRKYCSIACRRQVEEVREHRVEALSGMLLYTCAAPRCSNVFLPEPRNPEHAYCSPKCRKRAHRSASDLSTLFCEWCHLPLPSTKSRRRRFCGATCRKRAERAQSRNEK